MEPKKLALETFTEGDGWDGIPSVAITINGSTPSSPISLVTLRFKKAGPAESDVVELSSATPAQISLTNAAGWLFVVPEQIVAGLTAGTWIWQLRITPVVGLPKTFLADKITVLETV